MARCPAVSFCLLLLLSVLAGQARPEPAAAKEATADSVYIGPIVTEITLTPIRVQQGELIELRATGVTSKVPKPDSIVALPGGATMELVWVKAGTFLIGSPEAEEGRELDEGPRHEVTLSTGFWIGKHEITQGQWQSVMETTPWSGKTMVQENPNHPAVYISWNDVQQFMHALNEAVEDSLYRLPTEAEWEYACRAGTTTQWSFGPDRSQLGDYAWYQDNAWNVGERHGHAVGTKLPNPWGLYDMHGNVNEWCWDWYALYPNEPQVDPAGPSSGSGRVVRGGDYGNPAPQHMRSAIRNGVSPALSYPHIGARVVRCSSSQKVPMGDIIIEVPMPQ